MVDRVKLRRLRGQTPFGREGDKRSLAGPMLLVIAFQGGAVALKYAMQLVFARSLDADGFGQFSIATTVAQIGAVAATMGFPRSVMRFVPQYEQHGRFAESRSFQSFARRSICAAAVSVALVGGLLVWASPAGTFLRYLGLGLVAIPTVALFLFEREVLRAKGHAAFAYGLTAALQPALTLLVSFVLWRSSTMSVGTAVFAFGSGYLLVALGATVLARVSRRHHVTGASHGAGHVRTSTKERKQWLQVSLPLLLAALLQIGLARLDLLVLGAIAEPADVGTYAAIVNISALVEVVLIGANAVLAPQLSRALGRGDAHTLKRLLRSANVLCTAGAAVAVTAIWLLRSQALELFGPGFTGGQAALGILLTGRFVNTATGPVGITLSVGGFERTFAWVIGISLIVDVALVAPMLAWFGLEGVAGAAAATLAAANAAMVYVVYRRLVPQLQPHSNLERLSHVSSQ